MWNKLFKLFEAKYKVQEDFNEMLNKEVQVIFNKVIKAGHYGDPNTSKASNFMCRALEKARYYGSITETEEHFAKKAIDNYLGSYITLSTFLRESELDYFFEARLAIYKDWANRPNLKGNPK